MDNNILMKSMTLQNHKTTNRSHLTPKIIVDKNGHRKLVYVNLREDQPELKHKPKQTEETPGKRSNKPDEGKKKVASLDEKRKKLSQEERRQQKLSQKLQDYKKQFPNLSEESIKTRMKYMIPMDATEVKIYDSNPKYVCEFKDSKGRTQKRYTKEYSEKASQAKFERLENLHQQFPKVRRQIQKDLSTEGMNKDKICATIVQLIDKCYFRIGNEKYTEQNGTYGISTMRKNHLTIDGDNLEFSYVGKKSVHQHKTTTDSTVSGILNELVKDSPGDRLFQYQDENSNWKAITDTDIRKYLSSYNLRPKDFRTYHASRICATKLAELGATTDPKEQNARIKQAIDFTAGFLGHTPSICRKSYVCGKILEAYREGIIMENYGSTEDALENRR